MSNAFKETQQLFRNHTNYIKPLTYEEWLSVTDSDKAAVLYVQFYDQITLAWFKTKSFFVLEEDGVSTVLQYLMKNVPVIINNPTRFTPNYIYRVAYNCLYCISHDIKRDIERYENETSNIISAGEDELDLFDTIQQDKQIDDELTRAEFWKVIEDMGLETEKVVNYLLNGDSLGKTSTRSKDYAVDRLRDINVSLDEMNDIIEVLKDKLASFKDAYNM